MANKPDDRLIIVIPSDLLEEVRRAAEAEDLSVSQIVRRALRNELKAVSDKGVPGMAMTLETIGRLWWEAQSKGTLTGNVTHGDLVPGSAVHGTLADQAIHGDIVSSAPPKDRKFSERVSKTEKATIIKNLRDRK